jgi:hypothetical protein
MTMMYDPPEPAIISWLRVLRLLFMIGSLLFFAKFLWITLTVGDPCPGMTGWNFDP